MLKWGASRFHGKDGFQHRPMKDVVGGEAVLDMGPRRSC